MPISHNVGPSLGGSNTRPPKSISQPIFAHFIIHTIYEQNENLKKFH